MTRSTGSYVIAPLAAGAYDFRIDCPLYQSQESHNLTLDVASSLLINVYVRLLSDVWEDDYRKMLVLPGASVLNLYGPDVDLSHTSVVQALRGTPAALEATVSQVIDGPLLQDTPLSGRDAYTLLVLQPGATSDTSTARSLSISLNGQRPSASQFLLDGLENNNTLVTGPLSPIAPEAIQEYRISSNSFTAEYGRASGYIANAVTRAGTQNFHGSAYFYFRHEDLLARGAAIVGADPSAPFRETQPGVVLTGPLWKTKRLLGSVAWEDARVYTRQTAQEVTMPTKSWIASLNPNSLAFHWVGNYAAVAPAGTGDTASFWLAPPLHVNRETIVPRADWTSADGTNHVMARYAGFFVDRPDYLYSPYPGFSQPLSETTHSGAITWTKLFRSGISNELRTALSADVFSAPRPHPEVPLLVIASTPALPNGVDLPSSTVLTAFSNRTRTFELGDNVSFAGAKHVVRAGGGIIPRHVSGVLSSNASPRFSFADLNAFANDAPGSIIVSVARTNPVSTTLPDFYRQFSLFDWYGFVEDTYRPLRRLTISVGLRYDWFGAPVNAGSARDWLLTVPLQGSVQDRVQAASLTLPSNNQSLYEERHNGLAFRGGASFALDRNSHTVLRGSFGTYTDRPFDNLWQTIRNNSYYPLVGNLDGSSRNYTDLESVFASFPTPPVQSSANDLTAFASNFSTPRVMSWMAGLQHSISTRWLVETDYLGSSSGSLVTTDRLNRQYSVPSTADNPGGRYNENLPNIIYRANQGGSRYAALSATARYRGDRMSLVASYTLSSARDIQSDPLQGEYFDLGFSGGGLSPKATFITQGDPSHDSGPADFDRRHNFVAAFSWMLPGFLNGFRIGILGAVRSGSPFTVTGLPTTTLTDLNDNPADLVPGVPVWANRMPAGNGVLLLNSAAFMIATGHVGDSGRNRFYGPGIVGADASISREFHMPHVPERMLFHLRMDAYNVFNHANLGNPNSNLNDPNFGIATYGAQQPSAFRVFGPLGDTRRQLQLMLKVDF